MRRLRGYEIGPRAARRRGAWLFAALLAVALAPVERLHAECTMYEVETLAPPGTEAFRGLGRSIAVSGDRIAVGAPGNVEDGDFESSPNLVKLFQKVSGGWSQATIATPGGHRGRGFGHAVAFAGSRLVIAAPYEPGESSAAAGAVYVFEPGESGWSMVVRLTGPDDDALFGWSLAVMDDILLIGAPRAFSAPGVRGGAVFAYRAEEDGYTLLDQPTAPTVAEGAMYGWSLAAHGYTLVVGAKDDSANGPTRHGAAYVFDRYSTAWQLSQRLLAAEPVTDGRFGYDVAVEGDMVIVGAYGEEGPTVPFNDHLEQVHTFFRGGLGWVRYPQILTLPAQAIGPVDVGPSLALRGSRLAVGVAESEPLYRWVHTGRAYLYEFGDAGWLRTARMGASNGQSRDRFGVALAWMGERLLVGATGRDLPGGEGALLVFETSDPDSDDLIGACDLCPFTSGGSNEDTDGDGLGNACDVDIDGDGVVNESDNCPFAYDGTLADFDLDGIGDVCDDDVDGDLVENGVDNCPVTPNPDQADGSLNGRGDVCDLLEVGPASAVTHDDALPNDRFGDAVAFAGDTLVVSAMWDHHTPGLAGMANSQGSVFLFKPGETRWELRQTLRATPQAVPGDNFGSAIAATPERIVVGAPGATQFVGPIPHFDAGAVFVYRRVGGVWAFETRLQSSATSPAGAKFGSGAAVYGSTVVCSAPYEINPGETARGAVYVFELVGTQWTLAARFTSPRPEATGSFGLLTAVDGGHLFISDPNAPAPNAPVTNGSAAGAVYAYRKTADGWAMHSVVTLDDPSLQTFGAGIALHGDTALIGAFRSTEGDLTLAGRAYEFRFIDNAWRVIQKLQAETPVAGELYGFRVHLTADLALIQSGDQPRRLDLFARTAGGWERQRSLLPEDAGWLTYTLVALDPSRRWVAVGARGNAQSGIAESVQLFDLERDGACCTPAGCVETNGTVCEAGYVCDVAELLPATFEGCAGDLNGDGLVNPADRGFVRAALGATDSRLVCLHDLTGDGRIDPADVAAVSVAMGRCLALPPHQSPPVGKPSLEVGPGQFRGVGTACELADCP
jgi:hypothetical protein